MRVETNERLVRRNRQIAQYLFFITFAVLIGGLLVINQGAQGVDESNVVLIAIAQALLLPVAFISTVISVRMTNLWVRAPRPEDVIRESLKGLSNRSVLYNYHHIPARHVLICPQGVYAIVTRFHEGKYAVQDDKWSARRSLPGRILSLLRFDGVGNPSADAHRAAEHLKALLAPMAPTIEVKPLIIFTDPRATVEVISSSVPVVQMETKANKKVLLLKDVIKEVKGAKQIDPLTPDQIAAFEAATLHT
ncbi:MAG: nuclease-related domain-containing protein [Chloroflexota bacterium]|nr:nuclease-related domain-containing protein [Chloroflexota bacterium]